MDSSIESLLKLHRKIKSIDNFLDERDRAELSTARAGESSAGSDERGGRSWSCASFTSASIAPSSFGSESGAGDGETGAG